MSSDQGITLSKETVTYQVGGVTIIEECPRDLKTLDGEPIKLFGKWAFDNVIVKDQALGGTCA